MTRSPRAVLARLRARARLQPEEEGSGERSAAHFAATPDQKLRWLGSETLRSPTSGSVDVVKLGDKKRR